LPLLNNKQIGIVTNQTGILSNKTHLVDFRKNIVQKIFAPEHGFRELLMQANISLTEKILKLDFQLFRFGTIKPKPEQLAGIDIMVLICKMWSTILYVHFFVTLYNGSLCRK
jgi:uncharacterized protein YbbC (DUF1343 family)